MEHKDVVSRTRVSHLQSDSFSPRKSVTAKCTVPGCRNDISLVMADTGDVTAEIL
jgi:hypothetical protein